MSASPIHFTCPFFRSKESAEKAECFYTKIALFAVGLFLLIAGSIILSGIVGNIGGDIGWSITTLGVVALAVSCVRCHSQAGSNENQPGSFIHLPNPSDRHNPLRRTWPTVQDDSPLHTPRSPPPPSQPQNPQSEHHKKAEEYFEQGDLAAAFTEIKKVSGNEIKELFFAHLAEAHFARGEKEQAFKVINEICHNHKIKELFFVKLAEAYLADGNKEQAFITIKKICHNREVQEIFLCKLAEVYLAEGLKEQAHKTIKEICHNKWIKETFLAKLAYSYLAEGNRKQAFSMIRDIFHHKELKENFLIKLTQIYFNEGNKEQAFKTVLEISPNSEIRENFLAELAQAYFNEKNDAGILKIIAHVVESSLSLKLIKEHCTLYFAIRKRHLADHTKIEDFFAKIAHECLEDVKIYLARGESINALTFGKNKATDPMFVQEFLKL